ncbi:MAG: FliM/FliN family flagellar motor switch protein [Pseudomonadota bacterium]
MQRPANPALERALMDVPVQVDVVLGEVRMALDELMALSPGEVIALGRETGAEVDVFVSDRLMAHGRLVVADGALGVTLTEILDVPRAA